MHLRPAGIRPKRSPLPRPVGHWTMRPATCTLSSRPPTSRLSTWVRLGADTSRSTTRRAIATRSRESSYLTSRRTIPRKERSSFPGAKAWGNPEHLDNVDAMSRVLRLSPLALEDIPLRVITAAEGPAIAEKNQSAWLKLSSDAQQTTSPAATASRRTIPTALSPRSKCFSTRSTTRYGSGRTA
jgi:hypothetical protein